MLREAEVDAPAAVGEPPPDEVAACQLDLVAPVLPRISKFGLAVGGQGQAMDELVGPIAEDAEESSDRPSRSL